MQREEVSAFDMQLEGKRWVEYLSTESLTLLFSIFDSPLHPLSIGDVYPIHSSIR